MKKAIWWSLNGVIFKNPSDDVIESYPIEQRIDYKPGRSDDTIDEKWWLDWDKNLATIFTFKAGLTKEEVAVERRAWKKTLNRNTLCVCGYNLPPSYFTEDGFKQPF